MTAIIEQNGAVDLVTITGDANFAENQYVMEDGVTLIGIKTPGGTALKVGDLTDAEVVSAEPNLDGTYTILIQSTVGPGVYTWKIAANGDFISENLSPDLAELDIQFAVDQPSDIGADGILVQIAPVSGQYVVSDQGNAVGISYNGGTDVTTAVFGPAGWTVTHAAADPDTTGYKVLFENADGRQTIWNLDASGERQSREELLTIEQVYAAEVLFQVADLDDDPALGAPATTVIDDGSTNGVGIIIDGDNDKYAVTKGGVETNVKLNGGDIVASVFTAAGWTMTQGADDPDVEGGFKVLFENADGRQTIWVLDATGNRTARDELLTAEEVYAAEVLFQVNGLDDNPAFGFPDVTPNDTVDSDVVGATVEITVPAGEYVVNDAGTIVPITLGGGAVTTAAFGPAGWTVTQAKAMEDGTYKVLFENSLTDAQTIWNLDASGDRTSREELLTNEDVWAAEVLFTAPGLDGDAANEGNPGGAPNTLVDSDVVGATVEITVPGGEYVVNDAGAIVPITLGGGAITTGVFGAAGWSVTQAHAVGDGTYKVLFENTDGRQTIWNLDASGDRTSREELLTDEDVWAAEVLFTAPGLDGDAANEGNPGGTPNDTVPSDVVGATVEITVPAGEYVVNDAGAIVPITLGGGAVTTGGFGPAGWTVTQAKAMEDGTYKVLFENSLTDAQTIWNLDASGDRTSREELLTDEDVWAAELLFEAPDLDGNPALGDPDLPNVPTGTDSGTDNVTVEISAPEGQYFVNADGVLVPVTLFGGDVIASVFTASGWTMTQATLDGETNGYKVLFENTDGRQTIWNLDATGDRTSREELLTSAEVRDAEVLFDVDLDADTAIGVLEADGDTILKVNASTGQYIVENDAGVDFALTDNEFNVTPNYIAPSEAGSSWDVVAAESDPDVAGGFRILWEEQDVNGDAIDYVVWELGATGNFSIEEPVTIIATTEEEFDFDIPDSFTFFEV
jgi:hypothetical protein